MISELTYMKHLLVFPIALLSVFPLNAQSLIQSIAFGSCNRENRPQSHWAPIAATHPDVFIWTGDNVYADTQDPVVFRTKYDMQMNHPEYVQFLTQVPTIIGTWDDHDYGVNDGGKEYPAKELAKAELYRFLGMPEDEPSRAYDGIYHVRTFGIGDQTVKVILLDTRWFRDPLVKDSTNRVNLPTDGKLLGEAQWAWLETELAKNDAAFHVIVSSIQLIARDHRFEKWGNFPNELNRFHRLLSTYKPNGIFVISGDRHVAEISIETIPGLESPLVDITASGLTNVWSSIMDETNTRAHSPKFYERNFGLIEFDWTAESPTATISIVDMNGEKQRSVTVR